MKIVKFVIGITIMAIAVAMSKISLLGTSPIAAVPNVVSESMGSSIGLNTALFLALLVVIQLVLASPKKMSEAIPYLIQLIPGTLFGLFINFFYGLFAPILSSKSYPVQLIVLIISVFILAIGVIVEVNADTIVMPGEGLPKTIAQVTNKPFSSVKLACDIGMVVTALLLSFLFGNPFLGIREGTIIAMLFTGPIISLLQQLAFRRKK
ncbi:YczE/YyaS/YitT family protein [Streptococcus suis]|uniref:YczE/YyaS/YitT family protein n=1 Tax=Streptococcus suis TaxID=1307 RepID=UPI00211D563F|nr:DUF6198 family protein [Streptococcus suis]UUM58089.1 DUF6198 family protein [Streptococcus suis]